MAYQHVTLLYALRTEFDFDQIAARVAELTGHRVETQGGAEPLVICHPEFLVPFAEGEIPAQTLIAGSDRTEPVGDYSDLVGQSWATENADELLGQASSEIKVLELMTSPLEPVKRLKILHAVLRAMTEITRPIALAFEHSQQILSAKDALAEWNEAPEARPGCINVRYFNPGDGTQLMDTRGLQDVGLHDLQCHFKTLDPGPVAHLLTTLAHYIIENGAVIDSGHTVGGIEAGQTWTCRFEQSLAQPTRTVLDIDPGPEFAGGKRG